MNPAKIIRIFGEGLNACYLPIVLYADHYLPAIGISHGNDILG